MTRSHVGLRVRLLGSGLLASLLLPGAATMPSPSRAAGGEDLLVLAKDAVYGGALGLLLGGVLTLVVDSDRRDDTIRWGIVLGTFGGFGYGLYEISRTEDEFSFTSPLDLDPTWSQINGGTAIPSHPPDLARLLSGLKHQRSPLPAPEIARRRSFFPEVGAGTVLPSFASGVLTRCSAG